MTLRLNAIKSAALTRGIEIQSMAALNSDELVGALTQAAKERPDALIVLSPISAAYSKEVLDFATKAKVPLIFDTSGLAGEPGAPCPTGQISRYCLHARAVTWIRF